MKNIILKTHHPLYSTWKNMRKRCSNKNNPAYSRYGGRGIKVCTRWDDFWNFVADVGERPLGTSLDRKDNSGDYEPGNVRWATRLEQNTNTRRNNPVPGVSFNKAKGQWVAYMRRKYLGLFPEYEDAVAARQSMETTT